MRTLATLAIFLAIAARVNAQSTAESERLSRPQKIRKINLGSDVNSPYSELAPIISADGQYLFFTMGSGNPDNLGDDHLQDGYVSKRLPDGRWSTPRNLGAPINSNGNDAIAGVSADGSVLFVKNFGFNRLNGLCFARYHGKAGWKLDSITIDKYSNSSPLASQCISPDGKFIVFSAERSDGVGGADLYVSHLLDRATNHYSEPLNLGPVINTSSDEFAPFLAPDGQTLYFSSKGHKGYGDADVFVARRLDDSWTKWSEPKNLGPEINTPGMDAYYSVPASGDVAYFSSSNASNHMDIYLVTLTQELRPNPVVLVSGRVINQKGQAVEATVTYRHLFTDSVTTYANTTPGSGKFALVLPFGEEYAMRVEAPGYLPYTDHLDMRSSRVFEELRTTVTLDTAASGGAIVLRNIFFDLDKATLRSESSFELNRLVDLLKDNPNWAVRIEGYTDSLGAEPHNVELSKDRAEAVLSYLRDAGIDSARLSAAGMGSQDPVAPNSTEEGRAQNRRVVLRIQSLRRN